MAGQIGHAPQPLASPYFSSVDVHVTAEPATPSNPELVPSTKRFAINTAAIWVQSVVTTLAAALLTPVVLAYLGDDGYGLTELVTSIVQFTLMADLGIRAALSRHLAEHIATRNTLAVNQFFSSAVVFYLAVGGVVTAACVLAAPWIVSFFKVEESLVPAGIFLVRYYIGASILLSFLAPAFDAVVEARHRFDLSNFAHIVEVIIRSLGIVIVLAGTSWGLYGWAAAMFIARLAAICLLAWYAWQVWPELRGTWRYVNGRAMATLFSLGWMLVLNRIVSTVGIRTDPMVLSYFLTPAALAFYRPALLVVSAGSLFVFAVARQVRPLAAGFYATGQWDALSGLLVRSTRYGCLLGVLFSVMLGGLAHPLIAFWLGPQIQRQDIAAWTLVAWAVAQVFTNAGISHFHLLLGMNRIRFLVFFQSSLAVASLLASIAVVAWMTHAGFGYWGVVGTVVPTAVVALIGRVVIVRHVARQVHLPVQQYFRESYLGPLLVLGLLVVFAVLLNLVLPTVTGRDVTGIAVLVGGGTAIGLVWLALSWKLALDDEDRDRFQDLGQRTFRKLARPLRRKVRSDDSP